MATTDLFGKPLTPAPEFVLNKWQKRQATLLYHFSSKEYLKGLKKLLDQFINGVDITLDLAQAQGRDELIANPRWGVRDTAANFGTYGFPALRDFQKSVNKQIAYMASENYHATGSNQCQRLLGELSLGWTTPEEEERFEAGMSAIGTYAGKIDGVMKHYWEDGSFENIWNDYSSQFSMIPKFKVHTDIEAVSGKRPPKTGVYVPQDDPYGSLQFGWKGNDDGCLRDCYTFNTLGLQAVNLVGRDKIWHDDVRILNLVKQPQYIDAFKAERNPIMQDEKTYLNDPSNAMVFVSDQGISNRPCKWYFVELIEGEFEAAADLDTADHDTSATHIRVPAKETCPVSGFYFTPAQANSRRHFKQGDIMPSIGNDYGLTIWQWDEQQN